MAMNSPGSYLLCLTTVFTITLLHFLSPASCLNHQLPSYSRGLLFGGKARLGSTPPSCHNKCNQCHPCMAVQVPTLPSHDRVKPSLGKTTHPMGFFDSSSPLVSGNRYSNYKPLGWKCRCGDHFYNP